MLIIYKMNRMISEFQPALLPLLGPCSVLDLLPSLPPASPVFDCCYSEEAETLLNPDKERKGLVVQNVKNIQKRQSM